MFKFKDLKRNAKKSLKKNYVITVLVALLGLFFLSLYGGTRSALINGFECIQNYYDNGHFSTNAGIDYIESGLAKRTDIDYDELYELSDEELAEKGFNESAIRYIRSLDPLAEDKDDLVKKLKVRDGFMKPILTLASGNLSIMFDNLENFFIYLLTEDLSSYAAFSAIMGIVMMFVYTLFFSNVLRVGYARYFLENSKYNKTRFGRVVAPFRNGYLRIVRVMARKTIYLAFWNVTFIGGIIKNYSYKLVPYIVAEDSTISSKDAILLSRKLMNGYKWKAFLFDCTFIGWSILSNITFGLVGIFFSNPYMEGANAEFYKAIIKERKGEEFYAKITKNKEYIDEKLYIEKEKDYYDGTEPTGNSEALQNYKPLSLVALFFVFAFAGWCAEVTLFLLKTHTFVNRGTLYGPWLPIYGFGCVLILIVFTKTKLKKYIKDPILMFLCIMALCGALEYFTSWALEVSTGLKYWDYSGHFLSINGRICLENLCEFGLGGLLCVYLIAPRMNKLLEKFDKKKLMAIVAVLTVLFIADNILVRIHPRTGYGITDSIIDKNGNVIDDKGNKVE